MTQAAEPSAKNSVANPPKRGNNELFASVAITVVAPAKLYKIERVSSKKKIPDRIKLVATAPKPRK